MFKVIIKTQEVAFSRPSPSSRSAKMASFSRSERRFLQVIFQLYEKWDVVIASTAAAKIF